MAEEVTQELLPCPFCRDPMEWTGCLVRHVDYAAKCPIRGDGYTSIDLWNTRLATTEALRAEIAARDARIAELESRETCVLCAGRCRSHSFGDKASWEPEAGSLAWYEVEIAARDALLGDAYYVLTYVAALTEDSDTKAACKEVLDKIHARQALQGQPND